MTLARCACALCGDRTSLWEFVSCCATTQHCNVAMLALMFVVFVVRSSLGATLYCGRQGLPDSPETEGGFVVLPTQYRVGSDMHMACPNLTLLLLLVAPAPSCLFHSISYGLKRAGRSASAMALRREVANYLKRNAKMKISESPLGDWVKWDTGLSVEAYVEILVLALFFCNLQSRL